MKTLFADGKGSVEYLERPVPEMTPGMVRCRVERTLISAGTETGIITRAAKLGPEKTRELEISVGYSGAGVVLESAPDYTELKPGQRVAFYGYPYISHCEEVVVPQNLVYPISDDISLEEASFMGLGAIALHGFHQASPGLGEVVHVAGLGVIGNMLSQQALAAGCQVVASNPKGARLDCLEECAGKRKDLIVTEPDKVEESVMKLSNNRGADAVFLVMGVHSVEPFEQALKVLRPGGHIVLVGLGEIELPHELMFYREAKFTVSRAAGPGRYDPIYEKGNIDYPLQYVRWTEGRNCEEIIRLMEHGHLNAKPLISKVFPKDDVRDAYDRQLKGTDDMGYLIDWTV